MKVILKLNIDQIISYNFIYFLVKKLDQVINFHILIILFNIQLEMVLIIKDRSMLILKLFNFLKNFPKIMV